MEDISVSILLQSKKSPVFVCNLSGNPSCMPLVYAQHMQLHLVVRTNSTIVSSELSLGTLAAGSCQQFDWWNPLKIPDGPLAFVLAHRMSKSIYIEMYRNLRRTNEHLFEPGYIYS
jgi:hypothetical protein